MKVNFRQIILTLSTLLLFLPGFAWDPGEGMWIPSLLSEMNIGDMQSKGLKLSAEDIYSVNQGSLKDAIVSFGGFCTGSIISDKGLLITNHHCGYRAIQSHSSVEDDLLTKGFWATNPADEKPNEGLTATFIIRIEDVTDVVLKDVAEGMDQAEREAKINAAIDEVKDEATKGTHYTAYVRPFFYGNEYYLFVTETFNDVRLVGAPPSAIGKFGGDADNWMWPRHTGDFSIFRVYAGPDNQPADYSPDNVPLKPRKSLPVSLKGVEKGDFTMVYGFPGRTQEYLTSYAIDHTYRIANPAKIAIRKKKLDIIYADMATSDKIRIQYAAKTSGISNYWKKWIGENKGLKKLRATKQKAALEAEFTRWVNADAGRKEKYGHILPEFEKIYSELGALSLSRDYLNECAFGIETVLMAYRLRRVATEAAEGETPAEELQKLAANEKNRAEGFFKDFNRPTDRKLMSAMLQMYAEGIEKSRQPDIFETINTKFKGDYEAYADYVFKKTKLTTPEKLYPLLDKMNKGTGKKIMKDPAYVLMESFISNWREETAPLYFAYNDHIDLLNRTYVKALREMKKDQKFYPDANSTLRLAYGNVDDYKPYDGAYYKHFTTVDGILEKYNPDDPDFELPESYVKILENKDYGRYAKNGTVTVCFTASNHTTGGNSGSPVIDGEGRLIGVNFDRNWEGTMSDIMYDPDRCRNISVDMNYVLFVVDKVCGAGKLLDEMKIVQ